MVNNEAALDCVFSALTNARRRAILARLDRADGAGGVSVSDLAQPLAMKLPAMLKHLDVLEKARLVTRAKTGRTVVVRLSAQPLGDASDWLRRYERFWSHGIDRLVIHAEKAEAAAQAEAAQGGDRASSP